jgi:hypothetical protein
MDCRASNFPTDFGLGVARVLGDIDGESVRCLLDQVEPMATCRIADRTGAKDRGYCRVAD